MSQLLFERADQLRGFFFAMIESIPGGLLLADRSGALLAANRQAALMLGVGGSAITGRGCWELLAQRLKLSAEALAPLQEPEARLMVEQDEPGIEGGKRYLLLVRNELRSPFFDVGGFFLSLEDITYPAMLEAQRDRRKRFAAISELAVSLSQAMRNPLGGLELYASMLRRDLGDDPDYQRITTRMLAAIAAMNHLLDNILTFAVQPRPEKRQMAVEPWLEKVLSALAPSGEAAGVRMVTRFTHTTRTIYGDPAMLEQMMLNLGMNALESMTGPGEVELSTRTVPSEQKGPEMLELRWRDRGRGIELADRDRIFDPFFTTREGAKGLGLAIVHHIVEGHRGFIRVDSAPGRGSLFTVLLPLDSDKT